MRLFGHQLEKLPDEALMQKAVAGSEAAVTVLYHRYSRPLFRYFFRMLWKDKSKAEDFLHDLFINIMEAGEKFDSGRSFSTWIYSIAHNMCKNEYRKQAFRLAVNGHHQPEESLPEVAMHALDEQMFNLLLDKCLAHEQEEVRTMFVLRYELDMNVPEISRIIGCPEGTVKSRLFYLKKRLAAQLQQYKVMLER